MKTVKSILANESTQPGSLRILTGATDSGKTAIYVSGTPDGFRMMARLLEAQAEAADNAITKLERDAGELQFTTSDSVDIFEMHNHKPTPHHPSLR